jgi:serine/threonine protein kinase/formylglycine-generating enzyme required for sulfatase activity
MKPVQRAEDEANAERRAEEIFANYLTARETNPDYTAQRLLADHPSLHTELTALLSSDRMVERAIRPKRRGDPTTTRIDAHFGKKVDPSISLDSENDELESGSPMSDRLKKLRERGVILERYVLTEFIDGGGQGSVHKAWDGDLRRQIAIKFLNDVDVETTRSGLPTNLENRLGRFLEEAQITAQLQHPGIPPVHELGIDEHGRVYFTMKLIRGENLARIIERYHAGEKEWNLPRLLQIVVRVCETMAFAHARKVLHRDLKPQNILVGRYGETYVMDWGLARIEGRPSATDPLEAVRPRIDSVSIIESDRSDEARRVDPSSSSSSPVLTIQGQRLGTPPFMSPEQAAGDLKKIGPRSDVYAIGAVLYHLLAGHPPYLPRGSRKTAHMIVDNVVEAPPTPIQNLAPNAPPELVSIVERAMARDPAARYGTVADLGNDLRAFLEERVVNAYPTGAILQLRKWVRRNPTAAGLSLALVLVLVGSAFGLYVQENRRANETTRRAEAERATTETLQAKLVAEKQLGDIAELALLRRESTAAWPPSGERVADFESLLARTDRLISRSLEIDSAIADLASRSRVDVLGNRAFDSADDRLRFESLAELKRQIAEFAPVLRDSIDLRLTIARESLRSAPERAASWAIVRDSLARDPRFEGVTIPANEWLEPLRPIPGEIGKDPGAGLWEFWHRLTGDKPPLVDGKVQLSATPAAVFVLLPPGIAELGGQTLDPSGACYVAPDEVREDVAVLPAGEYRLPPIFASKFEYTVGQMQHSLRGMYDLLDATAAIRSRHEKDRRLPVDSIDWNLATELCRRLGMALPEEAEWEYFARAGSGTRWWTGNDSQSVLGAANVADVAGGKKYTPNPEGFDDGFAELAPVGSFTPNPFGLYDTIGNLNEWCATLIAEQPDPIRVIRGGSFAQPAIRGTSVYRNVLQQRNAVFNVGFRPVIRFSN